MSKRPQWTGLQKLILLQTTLRHAKELKSSKYGRQISVFTKVAEELEQFEEFDSRKISARNLAAQVVKTIEDHQNGKSVVISGGGEEELQMFHSVCEKLAPIMQVKSQQEREEKEEEEKRELAIEVPEEKEKEVEEKNTVKRPREDIVECWFELQQEKLELKKLKLEIMKIGKICLGDDCKCQLTRRELCAEGVGLIEECPSCGHSYSFHP